MKYYVLYVFECSPRAKAFKTLAAAKRFSSSFKKNAPNADDYWVDFIFKGKVVETDQGFWMEEFKPKKKAK
jgi:hypothetical protein